MTPETKDAIRHTLDALVAHLKLQNIVARYVLLEEFSEVHLMLAVNDTYVMLVARAGDRNNTITALKARVETIRDQLIPAFLGPPRE